MTMNQGLRLEIHQNLVRLKHNIPDEQPPDNVQLYTDHDIHMEAGDILFSRSNAFTSGFICFFTKSDWSHVAIAISSHCVLEATTEKGVDDISLEEFLGNNHSVILFRRPQEDALSADQKEKLQEFVSSMKGKEYTVMHAGLTVFHKFILFLVSAAALYPQFSIYSSILNKSVWLNLLHGSCGVYVVAYGAGFLFGAYVANGVLL